MVYMDKEVQLKNILIDIAGECKFSGGVFYVDYFDDYMYVDIPY